MLSSLEVNPITCGDVLVDSHDNEIMKIDNVTPEEFLGDCLGDLNSRRAQILSMDQQANSQAIKAYVPLGETFQYATTLRSLTTGRASFSMELDHYAKVPNHIATEISGKGKES